MDWVCNLDSNVMMNIGFTAMLIFIILLASSILVQLWMEWLDDGDTDNPLWLVHLLSVYIFRCAYLKEVNGIKHCYISKSTPNTYETGIANCILTCVSIGFLPLASMWVLLAIVYGWEVIIMITGFCILSKYIKEGRTLYKKFNKHAVNKDAHTDEDVKTQTAKGGENDE